MRETTYPIKNRNNWRGLLAGVVVWFLHLNIVNALTSLTCVWGWFPFTIAGVIGLRFIHIIVSLVAGLVFTSIIVLSWRNWHSLQADSPQDAMETTETDRRPFIAFVTMLLNVLFLVYALASLVMVIVLPPCA